MRTIDLQEVLLLYVEESVAYKIVLPLPISRELCDRTAFNVFHKDLYFINLLCIFIH